jgi:hypothetical protein
LIVVQLDVEAPDRAFGVAADAIVQPRNERFGEGSPIVQGNHCAGGAWYCICDARHARRDDTTAASHCLHDDESHPVPAGRHDHHVGGRHPRRNVVPLTGQRDAACRGAPLLEKRAVRTVAHQDQARVGYRAANQRPCCDQIHLTLLLAQPPDADCERTLWL